MDLFRFREKHTPQTDCGHHRGREQQQNVSWLIFIDWVISFASEWEDYFNCFWDWWRFPGTGPPPTPWSFDSALELSWHLWVCHLAC